MKSIIFMVCVMFLLQSCSNVKNNDNIDAARYSIDYKAEDPYFWDEYFEYSHYIALSSDPLAQFVSISKLIIRGDYIYIMCSSSKKLIVFTISGEYVRTIDKAGRGRGEYLDILDFYVGEDGSVEILDLQGKVLLYDAEGSFVEVKSITQAMAFSKIDSGTYILNKHNYVSEDDREGCNYQVVSDGDILDKACPIVSLMAGRVYKYGYGNSLIYYHNSNNYLSIANDDTVYFYDKFQKKLMPYITFDFNIERPSGKMNKTKIDGYIQSINESQIPTSIFGLTFFDEYIFGQFIYDSFKQVLISIKDKTVTISQPIKNRYGLYVSPVTMSDYHYEDDYILTQLSTGYIRNPNNKNSSQLLQKLNAEISDLDVDRPILIFYQLKNKAKKVSK